MDRADLRMRLAGECARNRDSGQHRQRLERMICEATCLSDLKGQVRCTAPQSENHVID
jgi:hypothetical protein